MRKVYINYADSRFKKQQRFALAAAKHLGRFDEIVGFTRSNIDDLFYSRYRHILEQKRGGGYWLWKPYFIQRTLSRLSDGDYLFYSDAGAFFLRRVDILISAVSKYNQDIMGFELPLIEKQWTKSALFANMECEAEVYRESNQLLASFMLIRKTRMSEEFFDTFLALACEESNLLDEHDVGRRGADYPISHRHDQSIFSLLYKKYGLRPFRDPSQLGIYPTGYAGCTANDIIVSRVTLLGNGRQFRVNKYSDQYGMVLYHNKNNPPILSLIKYCVKVVLSGLGIYRGVVR